MQVINLLCTEKECIEYIHSCGRFGKKSGLSNMRALLNALGNPHKNMKYIHVAGTNGKGSVSCMISNMLVSHGYNVGMNTSPYIERFNERLQINNIPIPAEKLIYYTNKVKNAIDKLNNNNCHPIEFEIITAIGFLYFKDEKCDFVVLECGIGGRLDSTNVIENPVLCVITSVGLDHTEILGNTVTDIAYEKSGIIKQGASVVMHPYISTNAENVIIKKCTECNAEIKGFTSLPKIVNLNFDGTVFELDGTVYKTKLLGSYQVGNAALAVKAAEVLIDKKILTKDDVLTGLMNSQWMCRFEYAKREHKYIIDGAHNYQGICEFVKSVELYLSDEKKVFVIGMLNEKDFEKSAEVLARLNGKIIVTDVPNLRQTSGYDVYKTINASCKDAEYISDCDAALDYAQRIAEKDGCICVAGSLYLAGYLRSRIFKAHIGRK